MEDCPFCDLDRVIIEQTTHMRLIKSRYPVIEDGHFLIVPRRHVESCYDFTSAEWFEAKQLIKSARAEGNRRLGLVDSNVGFNDGLFAGQSIFHAHIHVIMRKPGDVENPRGGIRNVIPSKGCY